MKKLTLIYTALAVALLLCAENSQAQTLSVFACEPEWAALAYEIGGDTLDITSATTFEQDPHQIQARPSLIAKVRQADLLLCSGAELEVGWLPVLLQKSANPKIQPGGPGYFMASDYVELLDKPVKADRSMGDVHMSGNPHVHTSPLNMLKVASALTEKLAQLAPEHKELYESKHQQFEQQLQAALKQWQPKLAQLATRKVVVYHDYWTYLEHWLKLQQIGTLEPKPGLPPTTTQLAGLVNEMASNKADLILCASYNDSNAAVWLSNKTGIPWMAVPATVVDWKAEHALLDWYQLIIERMSSVLLQTGKSP